MLPDVVLAWVHQSLHSKRAEIEQVKNVMQRFAGPVNVDFHGPMVRVWRDFELLVYSLTNLEYRGPGSPYYPRTISGKSYRKDWVLAETQLGLHLNDV